MALQLLDVNVLIGLAWPTHTHHAAARRWFDAKSSDGWATCPITECGFVRISSNKRIIDGAVSPGEAIETLRRLTDDRDHAFWPDDVRVLELSDIPLQGHQQITDAYLLTLAMNRNARLVTFDTPAKDLAIKAKAPDAVEIISG